MYKASVFRYFIALVLVGLLLVPADCFAQTKKIGVTVYKTTGGKNKRPWNNQIVYGFYNASKAQTFYEKCVAEMKKGFTYVPLSEDEYNVQAETDAEGYCDMLLPLTGYIVIKPASSDPQKVAVKGRLNLSVTIEEGHVIGEVMKTEKRKRENDPVVPYACGNRLTIGPYYYYIDGEVADAKSRMLVSPVVTILESGDTVGFLQPFVKDGVEFQKANLRRMGFDETRDPLFKYRTGSFMHSNKEDSLLIYLVLEPVDRKLHYKVDGMRGFVSTSKTPYRIDSICICEGYVKDPMRFLDYNMIEIPIDRKRYERRGRAEFSKDHEKLDLKFVVGEARLDPSDTLNFQQLNSLKENMSRYMGAESGITSAVIHGSASPEGGFATNERLCRERAEYLKSELSRFPALQEARSTGSIQTTHKVATWTNVANLLEADSLIEEASMVRAIIGATTDMRKQEENIRKLPCWSVIEQSILPRLRIVDIEYNYYTNRVKTREEIWNQYQTDPDYHEGKKQVPYEFYQLLDMIKEPQEREVIAKAAYNSVKDEDGKRAWPLAAYELAKCYSNRGVVDTMLLKPYIDMDNTRSERRYDFNSDSYVGWYNDEAIITSHVKMLAEAGSFASAYKVAHKLLPDEPKYRKLKLFLRCLNCEWNDPEVMDTVSNSSPWNKIVVTAAQEDAENWGTALYMLNNEPTVDQTDPRTLYLKAQMRFLLYAPKKTTKGYEESVFKYDDLFEPTPNDPEVDRYGYSRQDWGLPMVQCCLLDENFIDVMLYDGVFNNDYRKAFKAYWKKLKEGVEPMPEMPAAASQESSLPNLDENTAVQSEDDETDEDNPFVTVE